MRTHRLLVLFLLAACGPGASPTTPATVTMTTAAPTTTAPTPVEVEPASCSAPPVTFGLLCQVVELIDERHYDPPSHAVLAAGAAAGVSVFTTTEEASIPDRVTCAVPSEDFINLCGLVETRLREDPVPIAPMIEMAVEHMLAQALDPYTTYVRPALSGSLNENGVIAGAGIVIAARNSVGSPCVLISDTCPLVVDLVIEGGAGDQAGLIAADRILTVAGLPVGGRGVTDVAGDLARRSGETEVEVSRGSTEMSLVLVHTDDEVAPVITEVVGDTGYLRLPEFGFDTHLFVHFALQSLIEGGIDRLILDLRDNPGGFLFSVSIIGSEFLSEGILYRTFSPAEEREYPAVEGGIATRIPVTVLVNELSASSAEILASALQERNRATIVGTPTFGKNLVQETVEVRNGGLLRLTTATWTTPEGASVAPNGLQPDVTLEWPEDLDVPGLIDLVASVTN